MLDLQIRKMRAELNQSLQNRSSVKDIQAEGAIFEGKYGNGIWGCRTFGEETFGSLYNAHLQRERESAEWREDDEYKASNILSEIEGCGQPGWYNLKYFIDRRADLMDRQDVLDALEERRIYLEIPEDEDV